MLDSVKSRSSRLKFWRPCKLFEMSKGQFSEGVSLAWALAEPRQNIPSKQATKTLECIFTAIFLY